MITGCDAGDVLKDVLGDGVWSCVPDATSGTLDAFGDITITGATDTGDDLLDFTGHTDVLSVTTSINPNDTITSNDGSSLTMTDDLVEEIVTQQRVVGSKHTRNCITVQAIRVEAEVPKAEVWVRNGGEQ